MNTGRMKRRWILLLALAGGATTADAQRVTPQMIASGGTLAGGDGYVAAATVGQTVIGPTMGSGLADWQGVWFVPRTVTPASVAAMAGRASGLAVHQNVPNPFSDLTTVRIDLPRRDRLTVTLHDELGRHLRTIFSGQRDAGTALLQLGADGLATGSYSLRIISGTEQRTLSIMVVR